MTVQEQTLRELIACKACPALTKAVEAAAAGTESDRASLPYQQLLQALQSLPLTDYSGTLEASCRALLNAMRAGEAQQEQIQAAAAELCHNVPVAWGMISGTTGASKYFPITPLSLERMTRAANKTVTELQLRKFPLQPYRAPASSHSNSSSSSQEQPDVWRHQSMSLALAGPCEELPGGQFVGSVSSIFMCKYSKLGVAMEKDAEGRVMSTQPVRLIYALARPGVEAAPRYYVLWLCAAAEPGLERVTFLTDLFAGNMLTAISVLQQHWQELVEDLNTGNMAARLAQGLPEAAATIVNAHLSSIPAAARAAHAAHIQHAMAAHAAAHAAGRAAPLLGLLMPNLHAVTVVVTGSHSKFWPSLRLLIPLHVPVCTSWHAGTEGLYGISQQLLQPGPWDTSRPPTDQHFVMMHSGNCFFEYLPVQQQPSSSDGISGASVSSGSTGAVGISDASGSTGAAGSGSTGGGSERGDASQVRALTMDELQVGQEYELVVTTFAGLPRYRVGDVVRVEGLVPFDTSTCTCLQAPPGAGKGAVAAAVLQLPLVSFKGRVGVVLNLVWEKFDEGQLLHAVRDTVVELLQQQQQQVFPGLAEFTVYEDHTEQADKHYSFLWELLPHSSQAAAAAALHKTLDVAAATDEFPVLSSAVSQQAAVDGWAAVLNRNLGSHNTVYAGLLAAGQVGPARVRLVAPGTFKAWQDVQVQSKGISPSQFKMPTVMAAGSDGVRFLMQHVLA